MNTNKTIWEYQSRCTRTTFIRRMKRANMKHLLVYRPAFGHRHLCENMFIASNDMEVLNWYCGDDSIGDFRLNYIETIRFRNKSLSLK
jgi:hypothetical protein